MNRLNRVIIYLLVTLLSSVTLAEPKTNKTNPKDVEVQIKKFKYSPQHITINAGDTVVWINKEKRQYHNVWFKGLEAEEPDYLFPDENYRKTFNELGKFEYECGPHPKMTGSVTVE